MGYETKIGVYTHNGKEETFEFATDLSAYNKMKFIASVTDYLITDNGYYSIVKDLFFDFTLITMFTNIDLSYLDDSINSIDEIEDLVNNTQIVNIIKANMKEGLLEELNDGLNDNLSYRSGVNKNDFSYALSHLIKTVENKVVDLDTVSMMNIAKNLNEISGDLTVDKIVEAYSKTDAFKNNQEESNNKIVNISDKK